MGMEKNKRMINISTLTLAKECKKNNKEITEIYEELRLLNREYIDQVFKYKKFDYDFVDYITVCIDDNGIMNYFRPSYDDFLYRIIEFLNLKDANQIKSSDELSRKLNERINVLSNIDSEIELKNEFPLIYIDLEEGRKYIRKYEDDRKANLEQVNYYYSCAMKKSLKNFIPTQTEMYKRFVNRREEYFEKVHSVDFNDFMEENFDMNKVAMLVVDQYLRICESTDNIMTISRYLPSIMNYYKSDYDKNIRIKNALGKEINAFDIEKRIISLNNEAQKLKNVRIAWDMAPSDKNCRVKVEAKPRITIFNYQEISRLRKLGNEKNNYYENTPYVIKVLGVNGHNGYVGYVYENGEVILDREYNPQSPSSATGTAINNLKVSDFFELSRLDRKSLKEHPRVKWIPHTANWINKVDEIINREATEEEKREVKEFIKQIKR